MSRCQGSFAYKSKEKSCSVINVSNLSKHYTYECIYMPQKLVIDIHKLWCYSRYQRYSLPYFWHQVKDVLILSWNIFKKYSKAIVFITWVLFQRVHKPILCDLHSRNDNDFQYFFCYNFILLQTNGCEQGLQIFYTVYKSVIDIFALLLYKCI